MKNKEIEELLNNLKSVYELNKPLTDKYKEDCMRFVINTKEAELLLSYIEQLEKEYKELKDRNEINIDRNIEAYRIVEQLESNRDKAIEYNKNILKENWYGGYEKENAQKNIDILKGGSDYE